MNFNVKEETENVIKFIRDYYHDNKLSGAIIGISGGKDSAVVAALLVKALGKENVYGVTMPCHSKESDKADALLISDYYEFKMLDFDLTGTYDSFKKQVDNLGKYNSKNTENSDINLKPRLRMTTLYYLAALLSAVENKTYLVVGTSNKCELYVGYITKGGDSVHDISPIADFTVDEVIKIGQYLNVPEKYYIKNQAMGYLD